MKLSTLWNIVSGKPYYRQNADGSVFEFKNYRQYVQYKRGEPQNLTLHLPPDHKIPDLETLRQTVEDDPNNIRARMGIAAHLHDNGSLDEAYSEYLEAITLMSNDQIRKVDTRWKAQRAFAHRSAAKTLEQMGRDAEARQHWQHCADDMRAAVPHEKYLHDNPLYAEAMEKLK